MSDSRANPNTAPDDTGRLVETIRAALENKKGDQIAVLDVRGRSTLTDFLILASGSSPPHLKALRNDLLQTLKASGVASLHKAGDPESGWVVLDYGAVIVHLFLPAMRAYYALEALWSPHTRQP